MTDYVDKLIHSHINHFSNPLLRTRIAEIVAEAMKDQRHARAEAIAGLLMNDLHEHDVVMFVKDRAYQAAMNAAPKGE